MRRMCHSWLEGLNLPGFLREMYRSQLAFSGWIDMSRPVPLAQRTTDIIHFDTNPQIYVSQDGSKKLVKARGLIIILADHKKSLTSLRFTFLLLIIHLPSLERAWEPCFTNNPSWSRETPPSTLSTGPPAASSNSSVSAGLGVGADGETGISSETFLGLCAGPAIYQLNDTERFASPYNMSNNS